MIPYGSDRGYGTVGTGRSVEREVFVERGGPGSEDHDSPTRVDGGLQPFLGRSFSIPGYSGPRMIHQGGQGIVYEALQESTNRTVAVKLLLGGEHASEAARRRFRREIEIVAQLEHPAIVSIHDSGRTPDGLFYYVMEYVDGLRLDRHVRENALSLEAMLRLFLRILEGVAFAHEKGVIHRDLKPSNILIDREGRPKIVDFGLARLLADQRETVLSTTGQVLGTFAYMSPEQLRGRHAEIDERTDVYALGMILYEICTGKNPYATDSQGLEMLRQITETPPEPPAKAWNSETGIRTAGRSEPIGTEDCPIDPDLETIILRAIAKEKERRYRSVEALAEDLRNHLEGVPIRARRDGAVYRWTRAVRRSRVSLLVVLGVLLAVLALVILLPQRPPIPPPVDPETLARYRATEAEYRAVRGELLDVIEDNQETAGAVDPVAWESLRIVQDAGRDLEAALERDPGNRAIRDLLLKNRQKEIELLRKIVEMGETPVGRAGQRSEP
ncbi:MAG: protein kinase [Candidatus Eisenbacteria bacterium]|nr:protein kinase [Candidatus Latescibacterota bacterium]MBD3302644.1 protein kinase [Candidatus Eisenbacteria bacterium]